MFASHTWGNKTDVRFSLISNGIKFRLCRILRKRKYSHRQTQIEIFDTHKLQEWRKDD